MGLGFHGLSLDAVTVRFGDVTAVDAVSLAIPRGEVFALLGPSGSGKSSLLRAIAGLEPCAGDIRWGGESVMRIPPHKRGFALMFQDGQLFPHLDVAGNVGYALRIARVSLPTALNGRRGPSASGAAQPPIAKRVAELLDMVGLSGFEERRVTDLSGGEQQRVALARSLAASPRLLLLDEPLSSLDRELRERLAGELRDILRAARVTAIMVTHDHDEAGVIADRIGILDAGRLVQAGTLPELRANPADERIARFLA
ncbi:ABC transporter ATP-binding protein [Pseudolysinimonas sp.]|uniref:ABC transporter ATP-binding protein n=1 Tax=Pseudolysinimonas sp. TaxID=2680009 RepID=UPI00286CA7AD|nr:ABC transporter ATP-binding protein [Pseudolysinimonas sp.]